MLWTVDPAGLHRLRWEIPLSARRGRLPVRGHREALPARLAQIQGLPAPLQLREVAAGAGRVGSSSYTRARWSTRT